MRLRKNVKSLTVAEKQAFINAVLALKKKPSVLHPQDNTRSRYDDYPEVHMNAMMAQQGPPNDPNFTPGWAHYGPAFFPWHRVLILEFENDLAAIDNTVTLPYWDWTDPVSSPLTPDFLGSNGNPNQNRKVTDGPFTFDGPNHWTLNVTDNQGDPNYLQRDFAEAQNQAIALPSAAQVVSVSGTTPYEKPPYKDGDGSYRARMEYELHNLVHRWVGGTMLNMTSPNDPVFFMHHCNIDRLWWVWEKLHAGDSPFLPLNGATLGHNLDDEMIFSMGGIAPFAQNYKPSEVTDNLALNYTYQAATVPTVNAPMSMVTILYGIINDAPGAWMDAQGHIHHGGGGPGDPVWSKLSPGVQESLAGRAIIELAALVPNRALREQVVKAAAPLLGKSVAAQTQSS
jgi:tyrosinase